VICTEEFVPTVRAQARISGRPDYPVAIVPHPIGSLRPDDLRARADAALPQVIRILTGPAGAGPAVSGPPPRSG
jgi:hypothetical protein